MLALVPGQYNYDTRSASLQYLHPSSFRKNIRTFCPIVIGCYYWNDIPLPIHVKTAKKLFKTALFNYYLAIILCYCHFDSRMLSYIYYNVSECVVVAAHQP